MALTFTDSGESVVLNYLVAKTTPENLRLFLFKSNTTPAETDSFATYSECTFTGYASIVLTGASWGSITAGEPSTIPYAQQTFTCTANITTEQCYGYGYRQSTSGILIATERFSDGPYPITNNGDLIKVTPNIGAQ
jgi:hypothetical protein